jgi:hypothetical protein
MGWLSDKLFGKRKRLSTAKIRAMMKPSRDMMNEQIDISRQMMDADSDLNMGMRRLMAQRSAESGAQVGSRMQRMGAQAGMSPAQAMMQARMGMNEAMGGVNQQWQAGLQNQFTQGLGLFGNMQQVMQGFNEGDVNLYKGQVNAANARRNQRMGMGMSLLGGVMGGMGGGGGMLSNLFGGQG